MSQIRFDIPHQEDEAVLISGCGYNSLFDLGQFKRMSRTPFILHDDDPFITATLRRTLEPHNLSNIIVDGSDIKRVDFGAARVGLVLLGPTSEMTPVAANEFLARLKAQSPQGRSLISIQRIDGASGDTLTASLMRDLLTKNRFSCQYQLDFAIPSGPLSNADRTQLTAMTPPELASTVLQSIENQSCSTLQIVVAQT